ncbi:matrilin-1-like isoform X1 [Styela clava]
MQRYWIRLTKFGIGFISIVLLSLFIWKQVDIKRSKKDHQLQDYFELPEFDSVPLDIDNEEWLLREISETVPGRLVCLRRKPKIRELGKIVEGESKVSIKIKAFTGSEIVVEDELRRNSEKKASISSLSPTRPIGCCPPGDPHGIVYRPGSACCNDVIYNVSSHFCCIFQSKVMKLHPNDLDSCYSPKEAALNPGCHVSDLDLGSKHPMSYECQGDHDDTPNSCDFICPEGSRPKNGIKNAECSTEGIWNRKPICCQGCDENFQLDLWFLIQISDVPTISKFLQDFLSHFPVSQDGVRVGIYLFNDTVSSSDIDLHSHESRKDVINTIDHISLKGDGINIGAALSWMAINGFTKDSGDRQHVDNMVILILQDHPKDSIFDGAKMLKYKSDVLSIGVGYDINDDDLSAMSTGSENFYRSTSSENLIRLSTPLHNKICGESCIFRRS